MQHIDLVANSRSSAGNRVFSEIFISITLYVVLVCTYTIFLSFSSGSCQSEIVHLSPVELATNAFVYIIKGKGGLVGESDKKKGG